MKKRILIPLIFMNVSALALASCGSSTAQDDNKEVIESVENTENTEESTENTESTQNSTSTLGTTENQQQQNTPIVSDAYSDVISDSSNTLYCYHIPQINLSKNIASEINQKMYNELNNILQENVYSKMDAPYISKMVYSWGQNNDVISIIVKTKSSFANDIRHYVYNVSASTGKELSLEEFCNKYNLSVDDFYNLAKDTMKKYWELNGNLKDSVGQKMYDTLVQDTLAEENVKTAIPCLNSKGELCIIANIYSPAGAGSYRLILNTSNGQRKDFECEIDHSKDVTKNITEKETRKEVEKQTEQTTEKQTQPTIKTESETVLDNVNTTITKEQLIGEWKVDTDYTTEYNHMSVRQLYGSMISLSEPVMKFSSDGSFEYYVSWCYGKGTFDLDGNNITFDLYDADPSGISAIVVNDDVMRIKLNQFSNADNENEQFVFWIKK